MDQSIWFIRSANFVERQLGGEQVLVPITQFGVEVQSIYTLNETAAAIWAQLAEERTSEDLVASIESLYEAEEGLIRHDVELLLEEFVKGSFVEVIRE